MCPEANQESDPGEVMSFDKMRNSLIHPCIIILDYAGNAFEGYTQTNHRQGVELQVSLIEFMWKDEGAKQITDDY